MNAVSSAIELTRTPIRFNTVNPPGEERACAKHLGALLEDAGFSVSYHDFAERRTSLVARLGGSADKPPLCFTGHIDTVALGAAPLGGRPARSSFLTHEDSRSKRNQPRSTGGFLRLGSGVGWRGKPERGHRHDRGAPFSPL